MILRLFPICEHCVHGEGSECHTPECALFLRDVPPDGFIEAFAVDGAAIWDSGYKTGYSYRGPHGAAAGNPIPENPFGDPLRGGG